MNFGIHIKQKLASRTGNSNLHTVEYHHKYFLSVCLYPMKYFVLLFCIAPFIRKLIPSEINSVLTVTSDTLTTVPISEFCQQKSYCKNEMWATMEEEYQKIMCDKDPMKIQGTQQEILESSLCFALNSVVRMNLKKNARPTIFSAMKLFFTVQQQVDPITFFHTIYMHSVVGMEVTYKILLSGNDGLLSTQQHLKSSWKD